MGGFDPDVIASWKEESDGNAGRGGVALVQAKPGSVRVDVYAHVGSMNGRQILSESNEQPGAAFRRSHSGRAFPLWLAKMLEFSGEEDPGHEDLWGDVRASIEAGRLDVETGGSGAIGFLVHMTRSTGAPDDPPDGGWFARDANSRVPKVFPLGLASEVEDPEIESFRDRLLGREDIESEPSVVTSLLEIIEVWSGDPLKKVQGQPLLLLSPTDAYFLYWIAGFAAESPPRFELWVTPQGKWTPPASTAEFAVALKGSAVIAIGPSADAAGWSLWWAARAAATSLVGIPDGSTIDFAMAPRLEANPDANPAVGRAIYSGGVAGGRWQIDEASPQVTRETLDDALTFAREATKGRLRVRRAERAAFDQAVESYVMEPESIVWESETIHLAEDDERTLLLLASAVFRVRFGGQWPVDVE